MTTKPIPPCVPGHRDRGAFTLLELMLVLIIMSLIAVLAVPMFSEAGGLKARQAGEQLAATIRYAQAAAIAMQANYQIVITGSQFELRDGSDTLVTDPVNKVAAWSANHLFSIDFDNHPRFRGVTLESADFDGETRLWFNSMGAPYSGAIADNAPLAAGTVTLRGGKETVQILIEPVTGNVVVTP